MHLSATPATPDGPLLGHDLADDRPVAARHLRDPIRVSVRARSPAESPVRLRQLAYVVRRPDKLAALGRILDVEDPSAALVFGRTRGEVDDLAEALSGRGHDAAALHGGMSQEQRDRVMGRFREGALDVLVATDVAARGLDIEHVSHVVNFDVPSSPDAYVHRIGRTGRAGREGTAITLVEPREHRLLVNIEAAMRTRLERATIPTVADLRERRLELLRARIRERLDEGDLERYRGARPAGRRARRGGDRPRRDRPPRYGRSPCDDAEAEIAPAFLPPDRRRARPSRRARSASESGSARPAPRSPARREVRPGLRPASRGCASSSAVGGAPGSDRPTRRAITAEAGVPGSVIGRSRSPTAFPRGRLGAVVDQVIRALRGATIRGRTLAVRLDRDFR